MEEIQNLLIEGSHQSICRAIEMLQGCPKNIEWLAEYASARLYLPRGYASWANVYRAFMEIVGNAPDQRMNVASIAPPDPYSPTPKIQLVEEFQIDFQSLTKNVANETLFFATFFRVDKLFELSRETSGAIFSSYYPTYQVANYASIFLRMVDGKFPINAGQ